MSEPTIKAPENQDVEIIYLTIDHLKKGTYRLDVLLKNKVVKSMTITK